MIFRDHLDGAGVVRADILEGRKGFVAFLDLRVQGVGDSQGCKRDDDERAHIERDAERSSRKDLYVQS